MVEIQFDLNEPKSFIISGLLSREVCSCDSSEARDPDRMTKIISIAIGANSSLEDRDLDKRIRMGFTTIGANVLNSCTVLSRSLAKAATALWRPTVCGHWKGSQLHS